MIRRWFGQGPKPLVHITSSAWDRMSAIRKSQEAHGFLFAAESGGCSGLSYKLDLLEGEEDVQCLGVGKIPITTLENNGTKLYVDPLSEMFLVGTKIDYVEENVSKGVFDSKFTFDHDAAMTCGCGSSFMPKGQ